MTQSTISPTTHGNSASAQRLRLLARLRRGPITTLEARHELDVMHPSARIQELREDGYPIITHWTRDRTAEGNPHRVGQYILMGGAE
ncbi:hypothetical protein CCP3SC15_530009 [Gammaproteobacteria bacterium]